jgi:CubicO group peptidase (beta-lactamase class C family)
MMPFPRRKAWFWIPLGLLLAAGAFAAPTLYRTAVVGSGFLAQRLCSEVFIAKRKPEALFAEDLSGPGYELLWFFQGSVDLESKRASASSFGIGGQTAIYREGLGCTRVAERPEAELRAEAEGLLAPSPPPDESALWPDGERVELGALAPGVDTAGLKAAVDAAFEEPDRLFPRRTRALIIVHGGRIVAERYAQGFNATTPVMGWSMTKMALNALIGMRVMDGKLATSQDSLLPEWRGKDDPRAAITLGALLTMTSGLAFDETYGDADSDVMQLLFARGDMAGFAAAKPLLHLPGTTWNYSSGTSLILARILRQNFSDDRDYLAFPRKRLFEPLGMRRAVLEPDASGTFVASSFMYASARDWARLGLLYLRDGVWKEIRLFPEGWLRYSLTPAPASEGRYGAHVWLKLPQSESLGGSAMPDDAYYMLGHDRQIVAIVPSRDLVIVRIGLTRDGGGWNHARDLAPIVAAFPFRSP